MVKKHRVTRPVECEDLKKLLPMMDRLTRKSLLKSREHGVLGYIKDGKFHEIERCVGQECFLLPKTLIPLAESYETEKGWYPLAGNFFFHTHPSGAPYLSRADTKVFQIFGIENYCIGGGLGGWHPDWSAVRDGKKVVRPVIRCWVRGIECPMPGYSTREVRRKFRKKVGRRT